MNIKRDIIIYLEDIVEATSLIESYIEGIAETEFYRSIQIQDAILHRIQIIGEAAKHIPDIYRERWPHIPWKEVAGMRDIIVHEYFGITLNMVWKVVIEDIPKLKHQIVDVIEQLKAE